MQRFEAAVHGPPPVIDMTNHRLPIDGAVVNMIAHRPIATPCDDQGGSVGNDEPPVLPPAMTRGGKMR